MIKLYEGGVYIKNGTEIVPASSAKAMPEPKAAKKGTIAYSILEKHNTSGNMDDLKLRFDALTSHDITYVGIIETAIASGMEKFNMPYVLTNCHNSLCAVGGTINEDDHVFALSAAKKFGGIYVPPNLAVIHQYNREMMAGCGKMMLGSDSHTRYGAIGTMAIGEGGGELAKQLLGKTYDVAMPEIVAVVLRGTPPDYVGPMDVALSIIRQVFDRGYVKNKVMEFVGEGIANLGVEFRSGIDVMTTETTCLSSIWQTDEKVREYLAQHGREHEYKRLAPAEVAYYDGCIEVDLSKIEPCIAMPFHPSNVYTLDDLMANTRDIFKIVEERCIGQLDNKELRLNLESKLQNGKIVVDQGIIAGCAGGTYDNIIDATDILGDKSIGNDYFSMSVYPSSQPTYLELVKNGTAARLMSCGITLKSAFCGPCFGAGDIPANGQFSIRHTTRNFPNREGSKPGEGQLTSIALMDARSIAATAANGGVLTSAKYANFTLLKPAYRFDRKIYENRVKDCTGNADTSQELIEGPNIRPWPEMPILTDNILLKCIAFIDDPVTTTDELIPSGEASSYRSNPHRLAEFTLSRKVPEYVARAKAVRDEENRRVAGKSPLDTADIKRVYTALEGHIKNLNPDGTLITSVFYSNSPGDGSAREQAASCQRVLGGGANICLEYATKRYRSNLINWGILPFRLKNAADKALLCVGSYVYVHGIREKVLAGAAEIDAFVVLADSNVKPITLLLDKLTTEEQGILLAGSLINYNRE